ncbi:hypothetical protein [Calycomorphotria hydatis]|uniref:Glycosyltransferase RgtA/B/C/D-like domain-containing protein n=1 Tax=Calycomorphotria hydatis TaxID=2528027 RepID=A0A517T7C0_9PLAN|nr:hypothetical protein [Calycomorphotria hydatis]QDT64275.1 hypothetical protein V22_15070 [Calycomorphotria hydatis]
MGDFLLQLSIILFILISTFIIGRIIAVVLGVNWIRRLSVENILFSCFLGTAFLTLSAGMCFYAGLPSPQSCYVIGITILLLGVVAAYCSYDELLRLQGAKHALAWVTVFVVFASAMNLVPILWAKGWSHTNDAATYLIMADSLQTYGASSINPYAPTIDQVEGFELTESTLTNTWYALAFCDWFHMGALYFFALVRACLPGLLAYEIYPAVSCWGLLLNGFGIFCLARWAVRVPVVYAALASIAPLILDTPLTVSHDSGFLCQLYGTASFLFSLCVLSRLYSSAHWNLSSAVVFGMTLTMVLSTYNEFTPILTMACIPFLIQLYVRSYQSSKLGQLMIFTLQAVCSFILIANIELQRTINGIITTLSIHGNGCHVGWSLPKFWAFAIGASGSIPEQLIHVTIATIFLSVGIYCACRWFRTAIPVVTTLGVMAMLFVYYTLFNEDPWTHELGQTWNMFKLCKYCFPFLVVIMVLGMWRCLQQSKHQMRVLVAISLLLALFGIPGRINLQIELATSVINRYGNDTFRMARELRDRARHGDLKEILCVNGMIQDKALIASIISPQRPIWVDPEKVVDALSYSGSKGTLLNLNLPGDRDFGKVSLFNFMKYEPVSAMIVSTQSVNRIEHDGVREYTWLGSVPIFNTIYSDSDQIMEFCFLASPGPSLMATPKRNIWVQVNDGPKQGIVADVARKVEIPVRLQQGENHITIGCLDKADTTYDTDPRTMLVHVTDLEVRSRPPNVAATPQAYNVEPASFVETE